MQTRALLPDSRTLQCDGVEWNRETIAIVVSSSSTFGVCPSCGRCSERIHSRYMRQLTDLPWHGIKVQVRWHSRKFFCGNAGCARRIFAERLPDVAAPNGRRTSRLTVAVRAIAMACGGEGGARLAERLGMPTSPDTMLREIRRNSVTASAPVRVLGVDDWAMRRGHRYGTILVDLEKRQPIDLLPERSSESFRDWLVRHPSVEIISRDRGDYYIKGATEGAPHAVQVADRWHLLHNLQEAIVRLVERFPQALRRAEGELRSMATAALDSTPAVVGEEPALPGKITATLQAIQRRRDKRMERYQQVIALRQEKLSLRAIALRLGMHRSTVRQWVRTGTFPERVTPNRNSQVDGWLGYLRERWKEGVHNAAILTEELRALGFDGSYNMVRRRVARWRDRGALRSVASKARISIRLSPKSMAWLIFKSPQERDIEQQQVVQAFCEACPAANEAADLTMSFRVLVQQRRAVDLDAWLERATAATSPPELQRFAGGLKDDLSAVKAALDLPWSNGQTEGQVNRLKLLKRQMYGRANFDLLRMRVLATRR